MSRHNFLLQGSSRCAEPELDNPVWVDVFTSNNPVNRGYAAKPMKGRGLGSQDKFGNDGYATIEEARKDLAFFTKKHGKERAYRIVQVVA